MSGSARTGRKWGLLVLAALVGSAGCGSSTGTVNGKVSYKGTLLNGGAVTFFCSDGRAARTGIRADGGYSLDSLPPGKATVCVETSSGPGQIYAPPPGAVKPLPGGAPARPAANVAIPPKYADPKTTDLSCEVKRGSQRYDVEIP